MSYERTGVGFERWREEKSYTSCLQTCAVRCKSYKIFRSPAQPPSMLYRNDNFLLLKRCVHTVAQPEGCG